MVDQVFETQVVLRVFRKKLLRVLVRRRVKVLFRARQLLFVVEHDGVAQFRLRAICGRVLALPAYSRDLGFVLERLQI